MIELVLIIGSVMLLAYGYVLYPLLMRFFAQNFGKPWYRDLSGIPSISIILAVYNEDLVIRQCLNSLLNLDYPLDKIEILVGSDGSSDVTEPYSRNMQMIFHVFIPIFSESAAAKFPSLTISFHTPQEKCYSSRMRMLQSILEVCKCTPEITAVKKLVVLPAI